MPGFTRGRVPKKLGIKTQDTVEPSFDDVRVPAAELEAAQALLDRCLQLFGGYGYMLEYPIARIYAGTSEAMKVIVAKSLGVDGGYSA
ncbi:hypothetical protein IQ63_39675 [Streptomyces acidiscabies]|uniref:Acyl-CoA dehydrogenase/oxidase C-terminal domain-containing protein n=1 Tax=Streptomyces acidiscabies TaxID=42234 RepID=A0A0L0JJG2_9ACTN|nr:hypothetical protein IQ63_39675 [Streptomyces acidiscabies]